MDLRTYLDCHGPEGIGALARTADTKAVWLRQIAFGHGRPSAELCRRLEAASGGEITRAELRPDLFGPVREVKAQAG